MAIQISLTIWNSAEESAKQTFDGKFTDEDIELTLDEEALDDNVAEFVLDAITTFMDRTSVEEEDEDEDIDEDEDEDEE